MGDSPSRQMLSILQACTRAGVSRRTIYNWLRDGKVEYVRTAGGAVRIFSDTLFRPSNFKRSDVMNRFLDGNQPSSTDVHYPKPEPPPTPKGGTNG